MLLLKTQWLTKQSHSFLSYIRTRSNSISKRFVHQTSIKLLPALRLRQYQEDCITSCITAIDKGSKKIAVSLPTGGGKTVVFSHLIDRIKSCSHQGTKTLILVHRKELAQQAANVCRKTYPDKNIQIEMAEFKSDGNADIVIASIQTLITGERLQKFNPRDFKLIIIDEAHHASAESYLRIVKYFGITKAANSYDIPLVGFSATLRRDDSRNLDNIFDEIVFHMDLEQMVLDKHLVDAKFSTIKLADADLGKVKSRAGEFVISSLSKEMNQPQNNEIVIRTFLHFEQSQNIKSTLVFAVDIAHVENLHNLFCSRGVSTGSVTSKTKKHDRDDTIEKFKNGKISVLINCGIFTEGTDIPNIDCILLVRPTRSINLLIQMIGRGLRLHDGKEYCHIVDFVGVNNTDIIAIPTLRNLPPDFEIDGMTLQEMEQARLQLDEEAAKRLKEERAEELEKQRKLDEEKENALKSSYLDTHDLEIDEEAFNSIELSTYNSLSDFINKTEDHYTDTEGDFSLIKQSVYPWVMGHDKNEWVFKFNQQNSKLLTFLKLNIHSDGIRSKFLQDVDTSKIYSKTTLNKVMNIKGKLYTLLLVQQNPKFSKDIRHRFNSEKKFHSSLLTPISTNLRKPLSYTRLFVNNHSTVPYTDHTKFAKWRDTYPTLSQLNFMKTLIKENLPELVVDQDTLQKFNDWKYDNYQTKFGIKANSQLITTSDLRKEMEIRVNNYIENNLTKGDIADLITVHKIYKGKPFKRLVNKIVLETQPYGPVNLVIDSKANSLMRHKDV
ncbi:hypothetical protein WICMUC_003382 [Wickerhamomyces mucosus]|uniref:RNA helicase n=1 Tax=Wickerhamomyces mucosus TaxID=1378264 RepID=A0A9P8TCR4_9ASCO|nr:hypothetical protein WICMUC_003382 [Wickerhamomyces mucosus]